MRPHSLSQTRLPMRTRGGLIVTGALLPASVPAVGYPPDATSGDPRVRRAAARARRAGSAQLAEGDETRERAGSELGSRAGSHVLVRVSAVRVKPVAAAADEPRRRPR